MMTHPQPTPKSTSRQWLLACAVASLVFLAATMVPVQTTTAGAKPAIDIQAATDGIAAEFIASGTRDVLTLNVRVVGPDRFVFEHKVQDAVLQWIPPGDLADGYYHWEAWVVSANPAAPMRELTPALQARAADHWFDEEFKQTHLATGSFRVELGLLEVHNPPRAEDQGPSLPRRIAAAVLEFLVPSAHAFEEGLSNNFFGTDAGANDEGDNDNSFFGGEAGRQNTTGFGNAFFGREAGRENTTGFSNAFFGRSAGLNNTEGIGNAFFGSSAGVSNTEGDDNAFFGRAAGLSNTTGSNNAFFGPFAGLSNTEGFANSFFGSSAGFSNTIGNSNAFFGRSAGLSNTEGSSNAFFGPTAGFNNTEGDDNAFFGRDAGRENTTGSFNAFFGRDAGRFNTTGANNVFFGFAAGLSNTDEDNNTFIGASSDGAAGITNATALGHRAQVTQSDSLVLGSINGVNDATANTDVGIGISAPAAPLHVRRFDGTAEILIEETAAIDINQQFVMRHNGNTGFLFDNTRNEVNWQFRTGGADGSSTSFLINKFGTGQPELILQDNGNLTIAGQLFTASSRQAKVNISDVDVDELVTKLESISLQTWSYASAPGQTHIGPMAEDFNELFGFGGSAERIAPSDLASIALVTAQELLKRNRELVERNKEFEARLQALESQLTASRN